MRGGNGFAIELRASRLDPSIEWRLKEFKQSSNVSCGIVLFVQSDSPSKHFVLQTGGVGFEHIVRRIRACGSHRGDHLLDHSVNLLDASGGLKQQSNLIGPRDVRLERLRLTDQRS